MPAEKRDLMYYTPPEHAISFRQVCGMFQISSSVYYYRIRIKLDN
jgi:hypothetical protein